MGRTRIAVLTGARQCLVSHGSKTTMVDIAAAAGVAKATLYNHFRTKPEVFAALVEHEISCAAAETRELAEVSGLEVALRRLAERVGEHPVVRKLAATEPAVLSGVAIPEQAGLGAASWGTARTSLGELLGPGADTELVLRYLVTQLLWPAPHVEIERAVGTLLGGPPPAAGEVPETVAVTVTAPAPPAVVPGSTVPGLGFPTAARLLERVALG